MAVVARVMVARVVLVAAMGAGVATVVVAATAAAAALPAVAAWPAVEASAAVETVTAKVFVRRTALLASCSAKPGCYFETPQRARIQACRRCIVLRHHY